ncbi:MAG: hypothetical protein IVW54_18535 [Candidatus Binataceae bacterium]|nr:hypothetical protein [Candidatus Binataceae bacterium]
MPEVLRRVAWVEENPLAYDGIQFNCETFVNWLTGEKVESKQVTGWAVLLALGIVIRLAA